MKTNKYSKLESILNEVSLPNFVMAVSHLMDVGYRNMTEENIKEATAEINKQDDKNAIMTNDFMIFILELAYKISQAGSSMDVVKFTSKYID